MILRPTLRIEAEITIDDREAEVLSHLCSYGLAEWFEKNCSGKYTAAGIRETLKRIGSLADRVVHARQEAAKVILAEARKPLES